jgi:hypothetical protein
MERNNEKERKRETKREREREREAPQMVHLIFEVHFHILEF